MKFVISIAFAFLIFNFYAQSNTDFLKKEQQKLENKIANTKSLLKKVKNNTQISINELRLIDNQIKSREALVRIFDNQVRVAEIKMVEKKNEIKQLKQKLSRLKLQYLCCSMHISIAIIIVNLCMFFHQQIIMKL